MNRFNRFLVLAAVLAWPGFLLPFLHAQNATNPWTAAQTVQPAELAKELGDSKSTATVLFVGFRPLYSAGHLQGATFRGSGGNPDGLAQIKEWAGPIPRSRNLVIYCGCCPMEKCPNIRPAFAALQEMGFRKLRVLILPTSFAVDWAEKGLPLEKAR